MFLVVQRLVLVLMTHCQTMKRMQVYDLSSGYILVSSCQNNAPRFVLLVVPHAMLSSLEMFDEGSQSIQ